MCYETYKLDCAQYFTASNLSGDAFLRTCKADLHLLTNREHLDMAENLIKGGIASVFEKRLVSASNKFVKNYDPKQPNTFLFMIDANNLYGWIMEKLPLPLNSFEFNDQVTIAKFLNTSRESEIDRFWTSIFYTPIICTMHIRITHSPQQKKLCPKCGSVLVNWTC